MSQLRSSSNKPGKLLNKSRSDHLENSDDSLLTKGNAVFFINTIHRLVYAISITIIACITVVFLTAYSIDDGDNSRAGDKNNEEHKHTSHHTPEQWHAVYKLIYLYVLCMGSYFILQGSDPGYLPCTKVVENELYLLDGYDDMDDMDGGNTSSDSSNDDSENFCPSDNRAKELVTDVESDLLMSQSRNLISSSHSRSRFPISNGLSSLESGFAMDTSVAKVSQPTIKKYEEILPTDSSYDMYHAMCLSCQIPIPIRAHHCSECDRCVPRFDHHCKMLQTCIGEKNQFRFLLFCVIHLYGTWFCWTTAFYSLTGNSIAVLQLIILFPFLLLLVWLCGFHCWLMLVSTTGFEFRRQSQLSYLRGTEECDLPFAKCIWYNVIDYIRSDLLVWWIWFLCSSILVTFHRFSCRWPAPTNSNRAVSTGKMDSSALGFIEAASASRDETANTGALRVINSLRTDTGFSDPRGGTQNIWDCGWGATNALWRPRVWKRPPPIIRDSDDICKHPWQNKYYSCC